MNKTELESKSLADLHALAAEAGVSKYRMLSRGELIAQLGDGGSGSGRAKSGGSRSERGSAERGSAERGSKSRERSSRQRRQRRPARQRRPEREEAKEEPAPAAEPAPAPSPRASSAPSAEPAAAEAAPRKRRRRRFGRRGAKEVTLPGLLLPPQAGRQAVLCAETRAACTALLRGLAAELSSSKGPEPVALLIDPSPEELAEWRREAPKAEIVAAGQAKHAADALAQARSRAGAGDDVILLVDSLTRLAEAYGNAEEAKDFFDAGRAQGSAGGGSLTVVAALERS